MTREELKDTVEIQCKYLWNGGLNVDAAIATIMAAIGKVESREIPPPPLKWVDQEDHISARMFDKLRFSVYARYGGKFEALYMGYPIDHLEHPFQSDAIKACEAKWKEIWEKEMGQAI